MCFSAEASFTAAALLLPSGALSVQRAYRTDRRYMPICALPSLFGAQQLLEGFVWISGASGDLDLVKRYSIGYMFFSWLAWPIWVPFSSYFLEPARRKPLYLVFAIAGAVLGAGQYLPYLVHGSWLSVRFLDAAVVYGGVELFDFLFARELTYSIYLALIILPLLLSTRGEIRIFGVLVAITAAVTYLFFRFAYISVFCFGGALMSLYLVVMIFRIDRRWHNAVSFSSRDRQN
ncbi:MAG: hypothetical protein EKK31_16905 [Hyphomicrobiales bacterium]|nr:MAG: hypothetical protein EKK31_16905 [Hyphomicrobiales bacterium]